MSYRVVVAVSGRGSNLLALCDALQREPVAQVVLVLSDREVPALDRARERGIATGILTDAGNGDQWLRQLSSAGADLLVLAGFLKMVPATVIAEYRGRIINIHPALLPRHGGVGMYGHHVHRAVLAASDAESGATVHLVDERYDRGTILGAARVPVAADDDAASLAARVLAVEHRLLPAAVIAAAKAGHPVPFTIDLNDDD